MNPEIRTGVAGSDAIRLRQDALSLELETLRIRRDLRLERDAKLKNAQTSLLLVNGGAIVAILAFLGSIWPTGIDEKLVFTLTQSLKYFSLGVAASIFVSITIYRQSDDALISSGEQKATEATLMDKVTVFFRGLMPILSMVAIAAAFWFFGLGIM